MKTIDRLTNTVSREKLSCNALQNKELQKGISSNIEYDGIIRYTYSRDRGEIIMKKPQSDGV